MKVDKIKPQVHSQKQEDVQPKQNENKDVSIFNEEKKSNKKGKGLGAGGIPPGIQKKLDNGTLNNKLIEKFPQLAEIIEAKKAEEAEEAEEVEEVEETEQVPATEEDTINVEENTLSLSSVIEKLKKVFDYLITYQEANPPEVQEQPQITELAVA